MEAGKRLGRIVCTVQGFTVTEVLRDGDGAGELVGFSVSGNGSDGATIYASAEEAARAIDEMLDEGGD